MRKNLKRLEGVMPVDCIEKVSSLACHIEESDDVEIFREFAEILECYCDDYMTIEKLADVIQEAADCAYTRINGLQG